MVVIMNNVKNLKVSEKISTLGKLIMANNPLHILKEKKLEQQLEILEKDDIYYPRKSNVSEMYGKKGWLDPMGRLYICSDISDPYSAHAEWAQEFLRDKFHINYEFSQDAFVYLAKHFHFAVVVDVSETDTVELAVIPHDKYQLTEAQQKTADELRELYKTKPYKSTDLRSFYTR